jgi:ATP-dependent Lon protease
VPRAIGPIHVARPSTRAALDVALARKPPTVAVFAQRTAEAEEVEAASLHPIGCEALVHARIADGTERAWVVLEGLRWISLGAVEPGAGGGFLARVSAVRLDPGDAAEVAALATPLRARVRDLASAFPDAARLVALVDSAEPDRLADLVIANLTVSVDDKARYATELRLAERLRIVTALVEKGA